MPFNPKAWIAAHKPQAALGAGAVGAVGIGLYRRRKSSSTSGAGNDQVPVAATSAGQVVPYDSGSTAGGVPYDPAAGGFDPSGYLDSINQGIQDLQNQDATIATTLGTIATNTSQPAVRLKGTPILGPGGLKPHTGGKVTKAPASPKPGKKPPKNPRSTGHPAPPQPTKRAPARLTSRAPAAPKRSASVAKIKPAPSRPKRR